MRPEFGLAVPSLSVSRAAVVSHRHGTHSIPESRLDLAAVRALHGFALMAASDRVWSDFDQLLANGARRIGNA